MKFDKDYITFTSNSSKKIYSIDVNKIIVEGLGSLFINVFDKQIIYNKYLGEYTESYFCEESNEEIFFEEEHFDKIKISYKTFCDMFIKLNIYEILEKTKKLQELKGKVCQLTDKPL